MTEPLEPEFKYRGDLTVHVHPTLPCLEFRVGQHCRFRLDLHEAGWFLELLHGQHAALLDRFLQQIPVKPVVYHPKMGKEEV